MENKKISNLVVPITKKSLSLLGAVTIMATSISGCKGEVKNNTSSDISMTSSVTSEDETLESNVYEEIDSSNLEISSEVIDDASKDNSEITSNNSGKSNSSSGNNVTSSNNTSSNTNNQTSDSTNNNQNSSSAISTPSVKPTMPNSLTKENINDIDVFNEFVRMVAFDTRGNFGGIWTYYYNDQEYKNFGIPEPEFSYILAGLNDTYINNDCLNQIFGDFTLDDLKRFNCIMGLLPVALEKSNKTNNWDGLIINKKILSDIKEIEGAYLDYKTGRNKNLLRNLLETTFDSNNIIVKSYFSYMCLECFANDNYKNFKYYNLMFDLYYSTQEDIENYSVDLYNRSRSKIKSLN